MSSTCSSGVNYLQAMSKTSRLQTRILGVPHVPNIFLNRTRLIRLNEDTNLVVPLLFVALVVGRCLEVVDVVEITAVSEEDHQNRQHCETLKHCVCG